jgi:hypothetical protein
MFRMQIQRSNWQIVNISTPANYFHVLRRQLKRDIRKPLILMTPKSLLRHKRAVSRLDELATGTSFHRLLWDDAEQGRDEKTKLVKDEKIRRVVLCTGKVYYDLYEEREKRGIPALEIQGWVERPHYEAATHRLIWSMAARSKGQPADDPGAVNYNTYALGRDGYISLNLITGRNHNLKEVSRHGRPSARQQTEQIGCRSNLQPDEWPWRQARGFLTLEKQALSSDPIGS